MASDLTRGLVGGLNAGNNFLTLLLQDKIAQNRAKEANEYDTAKTLDQRAYDTEKQKQEFINALQKAQYASALAGTSQAYRDTLLDTAPAGTQVMGREVGKVKPSMTETPVDAITIEDIQKGDLKFKPNEDYFKNKLISKKTTFTTQAEADEFNKLYKSNYKVGQSVPTDTYNRFASYMGQKDLNTGQARLDLATEKARVDKIKTLVSGLDKTINSEFTSDIQKQIATLQKNDLLKQISTLPNYKQKTVKNKLLGMDWLSPDSSEIVLDDGSQIESDTNTVDDRPFEIKVDKYGNRAKVYEDGTIEEL